jgi:hypothetical protein
MSEDRRDAIVGVLAGLGICVLLWIGASGGFTHDDPVECQHEDGSGAGQAFPCVWSGGPNGLGSRYTLTAPLD